MNTIRIDPPHSETGLQAAEPEVQIVQAAAQVAQPLSEGQFRMRFQRAVKNRLVLRQHNHGEPIRTHIRQPAQSADPQ
jgi:hypothetical protein